MCNNHKGDKKVMRILQCAELLRCLKGCGVRINQKLLHFPCALWLVEGGACRACHSVDCFSNLERDANQYN